MFLSVSTNCVSPMPRCKESASGLIKAQLCRINEIVALSFDVNNEDVFSGYDANRHSAVEILSIQSILSQPGVQAIAP